MSNSNTVMKEKNSSTDLALLNHQDHLSAMVKLSALMNSSLEIGVVRERAVKAARAIVSCQACSLLLINNQTGGLYFDVATGNGSTEIKNIELEKGQGIAGWVAENKTAIIIRDTQNDPRFYKNADKKTGFLTENMVCVPVVNKNKTIGVLQAINKKSETFTRDDARILAALANQIAIALENARLYEELKDSLYSVVNVLANTIEKRDPYSTGHSKRVAKFALAIGKQLGMAREELINIKLAAILHDVGMIAVSDGILRKKSRLLEDEKEEVMKHVTIGAELLSDIKPLRNIVPAVKYHHENYDGSGYFGLEGENIPLIARIIAVADSFDSMTNERPYHRCKGYDAARRYIHDQAGKKYDPEIVNAFFKSKAFRHVQRHFNQ